MSEVIKNMCVHVLMTILSLQSTVCSFCLLSFLGVAWPPRLLCVEHWNTESNPFLRSPRERGVCWGNTQVHAVGYTNLPIFVSVYSPQLSLVHWLNHCCITFRIKAIFVSECFKNTSCCHHIGFQAQNAPKPVFLLGQLSL